MTTVANFTVNRLSVNGDTLGNSVDIGRNAAGTLFVNGGAIAVSGGPATVANTTLIQAFGLGGNDVIRLDESNGALPAANLFGGDGADILQGGSGADQVFGQEGADNLQGRGGADLLFGGNGNDVLIGGDGDDQMFGQGGNDRMIWNPGDDSDFMEGGEGNDTAEVNGGNGAEVFTATANGARVRLDRVDPAPFALDIGTTENIVVNMNGGNDTFSATGNLAPLTAFTVDGGTGDDRIFGGNGADVLLGGDGNDFIDGQQGNDVVFLGNGNDRFQWDPGDGNDVVEGQGGTDTMLFNGSAGNERMQISANGERVRMTRDLANINMDLNDVERIEVNALAGTDNIVIGNMDGTDLAEVAINLAETTAAPDTVTLQGRATGNDFSFSTNGAQLLARSGGVDAIVTGAGAEDVVVAEGVARARDAVVVLGANAADTFRVTAAGDAISVQGLGTTVNVRGVTDANDSVTVRAGAGNDSIEASGNLAPLGRLTLDAGTGNDRILGSNGADTLLGGDGDDFIDGQQGNDVAFLGAGNDIFQWDPGDGSDVVEGQGGIDTMDFNGAAIAENISISANGGRVSFFRDVANVTMDLNDVERIQFDALAGADNIVINDLSATDAQRVTVNLAGPAGTADGAADTVTARGSAGSDLVTIRGNAAETTISGLGADVQARTLDAGLDRLVVEGGAGSDLIDARGSAANGARLTLDGGAGSDVLLAGVAGATLLGGAGDDVLVGNAGNDTLVAGAGNDILFGGAGNDLFSGDDDFTIVDFRAGAGAGDRIDVSAVAGLDDFGDVLASARGFAGGVVLDFGADEITLLGVSAAQLNADDFLI